MAVSVESKSKEAGVQIRSCTPEDVSLFPEFARQISEETSNTLMYPGMKISCDKVAAAWKSALLSKHECYIGAFCQKQLVGQIHFKLIKPEHPRMKHVGEFFIMVGKPFWGSGLAQKLMGLMEKFAKECGVRRIQASVITSNKRAVAFYRKQGFKIEGCQKGRVLIDGALCDEFLIAKLL